MAKALVLSTLALPSLMTLRSRATRYFALQCYDYGVMIAVGLAGEAVRGTKNLELIVLAFGTYHSSISWVPRSGAVGGAFFVSLT